MQREIPYFRPHIAPKSSEYIQECLDSGWLTTGKKAAEFERQTLAMINAKYGVVVSSGTAALHIAYKLAGISTGDEVIVPSFTFCSTVNMLVHLGATPVFCDVEETTYCADPQDIERKITSRTKAIVVVHYGGRMANMDPIEKIASQHGLVVVEDAAHAYLAKRNNVYAGTTSYGCFSFYANKNLTTAEGGLLVCPDESSANRARLLSLHGMSKEAWTRYDAKGSWRYDVLEPGFKYNLTDIHAAIGLAQLEQLDWMQRQRERVVEKYNESLADIGVIVLPDVRNDPQSYHALHLYPIRVLPQAKVRRDELLMKLKQQGVGTSVHFIPNHLQPYYQQHAKEPVSLPVTENIANQILSLPLYPDLSNDDVHYIAEIIRNELV